MDHAPGSRQGEVDTRVERVRVRDKSTETFSLILPFEPPSLKGRPKVAK